jgi:hypothetical protein
MGTPSRFEKIKRFAPGQEAGIEQMLSQALGGLQGMGGAPSFEPIRERAMKTYQEDIVPSLAERFSGIGAQRSSGFREALSKGGTDLASTLAGMESQFGQQRFGNLMQMLGVGLTPTEETGYFAGREGALGPLSQAAGSYLPAIGGAAGTAMGGPVGEAVGTGAGGLLSLLLSLLGQQAQQQQPAGSISYRQS